MFLDTSTLLLENVETYSGITKIHIMIITRLLHTLFLVVEDAAWLHQRRWDIAESNIFRSLHSSYHDISLLITTLCFKFTFQHWRIHKHLLALTGWKTSITAWKYNVRTNVKSDFSVTTMHKVAIIFLNLEKTKMKQKC